MYIHGFREKGTELRYFIFVYTWLERSFKFNLISLTRFLVPMLLNPQNELI